MSKYQHMSAEEIVSDIEKFGTDEQQLIVSKVYKRPEHLDWDLCPECAKMWERIEKAGKAIRAAQKELEDAEDQL